MSAARRRAASVLAFGAVLAVTGCSGSAAPRRTVTKIVNPSPAPPSSSAGASAAASSTPSAAAPTAPTALHKLPGTCDDLLPQAVVEDTMHTSLSGDTA